MSAPALLGLLFALYHYWVNKRIAFSVKLGEGDIVCRNIAVSVVRGVTLYALCETAYLLIAVMQ